MYEAVAEITGEAEYHEDARIVVVRRQPVRLKTEKPVAVVTGGTADIAVAEEAAVTAEVLGNRVERLYDVGEMCIRDSAQGDPRLRLDRLGRRHPGRGPPAARRAPAGGDDTGRCGRG